MKLATLKNNTRTGQLIVVDRALKKAIKVPEIAETLQQALENWAQISPKLQQKYDALNNGDVKGFFLNFENLASPLPRAYQWLDGSVYLPHVERVRKSRGAEVPASFLTDPLMYQGASDTFLGPFDPIPLKDEAWGLDCEAEVAVITDDVPLGISKELAGNHIKLIMLVNDISLRNLAQAELAKGFGFLQCKPSSAFSPVAVTPDELENAWQDFKVHLPLDTHINDARLGNPNAGVDMQFNFAELTSHAAKTRNLSAGTIIGSGTVSNRDESRGCSCLVEKRVLETLKEGAPKTPFLKRGDSVEIKMLDAFGNPIFGVIKQVVI